MSLVLATIGRFLKGEAYVQLAENELPGTSIAHCTQLYDKNLAFDVLSSEHKSNILNGDRSFYEAFLRHLKISYCNVPSCPTS